MWRISPGDTGDGTEWEGERDRCPGERTQRSAAANHTVAETPSLVNFSAWLMHRLEGGGSSYSTCWFSCICEVKGLLLKKYFCITLQIHALQNSNKSASSQQWVLTIRSLPGFPGRKVLTLCALAIWDVSGFVSCLLVWICRMQRYTCHSIPAVNVLYASAARERKIEFFVTKASRRTQRSNRHWTKL